MVAASSIFASTRRRRPSALSQELCGNVRGLGRAKLSPKPHPFPYIYLEKALECTIPSPKVTWNECGFCSTVGATKLSTEEPQKPMPAILPFLLCLQSEVAMTTIRQFSQIALAILAMTGRVTMLGISRWTGHSGSYRTVQRFFATTLPWAALLWLFFRTHLFHPTDVYLLAGDETVVSKAGKHTPGLDRFFASLYGKPIPGLAFFTLALISVNQ